MMSSIIIRFLKESLDDNKPVEYNSIVITNSVHSFDDEKEFEMSSIKTRKNSEDKTEDTFRFFAEQQIIDDCKTCLMHLFIKETNKKYKIEIQYCPREDTIDSVAESLITQMNINRIDNLTAIAANIEQALLVQNFIGLRKKDFDDISKFMVELEALFKESKELISIWV